MRVSAITCTGNRPKAFALCEKWMNNQSCKPNEWVIVNDGNEPIKLTEPTGILTRIIEPQVKWEKGHTLGHNLLVGMAAASGDVLAFIEDDDYYGPQYLERMLARLDPETDIVGESHSVYYNVKHRVWIETENYQHSSLCQTILKRRVAGAFADIVQTAGEHESFYDVALWRMVFDKFSFHLLPRKECVGIKGLPGRPGIGCGHTPNDTWKKDPELGKLHELIGSDADFYKEYYED